jgi:hypothetical protein
MTCQEHEPHEFFYQFWSASRFAADTATQSKSMVAESDAKRCKQRHHRLNDGRCFRCGATSKKDESKGRAKRGAGSFPVPAGNPEKMRASLQVVDKKLEATKDDELLTQLREAVEKDVVEIRRVADGWKALKEEEVTEDVLKCAQEAVQKFWDFWISTVHHLGLKAAMFDFGLPMISLGIPKNP